jgi:hypothetical protein
VAQGVRHGVALDPPYVLAPGKQFGFGFRKAVLGLSNKDMTQEAIR